MDFPARRDPARLAHLPADLRSALPERSVDGRFMASIRSFHRITPEEAADGATGAAPYRHRASRRQPAALSKRMAGVSDPLDTFLILNGLDTRHAIPSGQRYKIVARDRPRKLSGQVVAATHNKGKLAELRDLLAPHGLELVSAGELGLPEPEETGDTSSPTRSSRRGPRRPPAACPRFPTIPVSASSGSAARPASIPRAGPGGGGKDFCAGDGAHRGRDLSRAAAPKPWRAYFVSALAIAWPDGHVETFEGRVDGDLVFPPRGTRGFGYDPVLQAGRPCADIRRDDGRARSTAFPPTVRSPSRIGRARFRRSRGPVSESTSMTLPPLRVSTRAQIRAGARAARAVLSELLEVQDLRRHRRDDGAVLVTLIVSYRKLGRLPLMPMVTAVIVSSLAR